MDVCVMKHSESAEQIAVVEWSKYHNELKNLMMIANGAFLAGTKIQRAKQMSRMKKEGFRVGASDLFLPLARNNKHGLWCEMKVKGGRVSDNQKKFLLDMDEAGYECVVAFSAEEAIDYIKRYVGMK